MSARLADGRGSRFCTNFPALQRDVRYQDATSRPNQILNVFNEIRTSRELAMRNEDDFRVRPGKIRSRGTMPAKPFIAQALAAAERAGGHVSRVRVDSSQRGIHALAGAGPPAFAPIGYDKPLGLRTVKVRIVRQALGAAGALGAHLNYLRREGVTRDGERARMFGSETDEADVKAFNEGCEDDRHHFRSIVSPKTPPN